MDAVLKGFLIGFAIAVVLVFFEYRTVKKAVVERAAARHQKPQFEPQDKSRIRAVVNFSIFLPPGFAVGAWLIERFMS